MFWADIIVRGTGGDNAGHTIRQGAKEKIFHLIPSGILGDKKGKITIIGPGTVVYPKSLYDEMLNLSKVGLTFRHLKISKDAKLILPTHIFEDRAKELKSAKGKIGTTGKGIGPAYTDHYARIGLTMNDLLNEEVFRKKLKRHLSHKEHLLNYPADKAKEIMCCDHLMGGVFYDPKELFNFEQIVYQYVQVFGNILKSYIVDTDKIIQKALKEKKNILVEGAQGDLLSVDYGTYPYVTSSDSSLEGLVKGCGLRTEHVDMDLGIIKGFMETRVGSGPFPSEIYGNLSEIFCDTRSRVDEDKKYPEADINSEYELIESVALRRAGKEYGATTGRLRRIGWIDLPLLRNSLKRGSDKTRLVLTKLDVLTGKHVIKVCTHYLYKGNDYYNGQKLYSKDCVVLYPPMDSDFLRNCEPVYREFAGWTEDINKVRTYEGLPKELKDILEFILESVGMEHDPAIISVGAEREETIVL
jgi:adenylosuccinate synthase